MQKKLGYKMNQKLKLARNIINPVKRNKNIQFSTILMVKSNLHFLAVKN